MRLIIGKLIRLVLGIDDTELPQYQIRYLDDVAKNNKKLNINKENLIMFIESLKEKHGIEELTLFRKGMALFSSEKDGLEQITNLHDTFTKTNEFMNKKVIMLKDKEWIILFQREEFVFAIKKFTKLNEFEIHAIVQDTLKELDNILLEERNVMENYYNMNA